jgi:hypothetical protein
VIDLLTKQATLLALPFDTLISFAFEAKLLKKKWTNLTKKELVRNLLRTLSESECQLLRYEYEQTGGYTKTLEQILFQRPTANRLREAFIANVLHGSPGVIGKEFRLNGTRADVVQFNGSSSAYEIKSARDTFSRLSKQLSFYSKIFEYTNVVCDGQPPDTISERVGVFEARRTGEKLDFYQVRKPCLNQTIDSVEQLNLLRLRELSELVKAFGVRDRLSRSSMTKLLSAKMNPTEINENYKSIMIRRLSQTHRESFEYPALENVQHFLL